MSYLPLTLISMASLGVFYFLVKLISGNIATIVIPLIGNIVIVVVIITYLRLTGTPIIPKRRIYLLYTLLAAIPLSVALIALYTAIALGPMSVVMPVYGLSVLVTAFLGIVALREKVTVSRLLGLVLAAGAIVLLSL
ncbi:MAG: EamA family transporter [Dehalococcoidales bacterium]